jgi:hypothetical protein
MTLQYSVSAQEVSRFPSFAPEHAPPADYTGMVFQLSQDYPVEAPAAEVMPWDSINFFTDPFDYARAVLKYGVEGNVEVDWMVQNNQVRKWYHAPWMHPGCGGREFIRGMTRERSSRPGELHSQQTEWCDNWAVGFYNPPGGFTMGQVWKDAEAPDPTRAVFPHGTVGMKLLFTTATVAQAPFLDGSLEWTGNIYPLTGSNPCAPGGPNRENLTLRLLQIDIAVRDKRKDATTGWVFGTFIYDGAAEGETPFDRMQPVGLMWADDSNVISRINESGAFINSDLKDGKLNPELIGPEDPDNPKKAHITHAGLGGRLNGPVDNRISSCMSCHGRAAAPSQAEVPSGISTPEQYTQAAFEKFFAEIPHGAETVTQPDGTKFTRLDYSLQLAVGIRNFSIAHPTEGIIAPLALVSVVGPEISRGDDESSRWEKTVTNEGADDKNKSDEPLKIEPDSADKTAPAALPAEAEKPGQSSLVYLLVIGLILVGVVVVIYLMSRKQA